MKMTLWLKECVQKVLPKQVMSQEPSCLEELVLACYAGKHSRVKELWKQLDSQTLVNCATNFRATICVDSTTSAYACRCTSHSTGHVGTVSYGVSAQLASPM